MMLNTIVRPLLISGLLVFLAGCVTTTNQPSRAVNKEKALETHIQLGLGYLGQNNHESARLHLDKALKYDSQSPGALGAMALLYQMEAQPELAEEYFKKSLRVDPSLSRTRNNYGAFLYGQKRYQEAYQQFKYLADDFGYERRATALLSLGRVCLKLDKVAEGKQAFTQALGVSARLAPAHLELADLAFQAGDYQTAKYYHGKFVELQRQTPRSLWLGIQIERIFGNKDKEASYALVLKNLYAYSNEYLLYQQSVKHHEQ